MSNNTTLDPIQVECKTRFWYPYQDQFSKASYEIITPICFLFAIFGNTASLIAFYKQSKKEAAYLQQIFVTVSEFVLAFCTTYYAILLRSFATRRLSFWVNCYICQWLTVYTAPPSFNTMYTITQLMILSMAADRSLCMIKPIMYVQKCGRRYHFTCAFICILVGILTNLFDPFQMEVVIIDGLYRVGLQAPYKELRNALAQLRSAVRMAATVCLICCNAILTYIYRQRRLKIATITIDEPEKEKKRREAENTLLFLAIFQSFSSSMSTIINLVFWILVYSSATFKACDGNIVGPITDIIMIVGDTLNFYLMLVKPQFRAMIKDALGFKNTKPTAQSMSTPRLTYPT